MQFSRALARPGGTGDHSGDSGSQSRSSDRLRAARWRIAPGGDWNRALCRDQKARAITQATLAAKVGVLIASEWRPWGRSGIALTQGSQVASAFQAQRDVLADGFAHPDTQRTRWTSRAATHATLMGVSEGV